MFSDTLDRFDPETNYLDELQSAIECNEFSVQEFTETLKNSKNNMLNIVNYNVRSLIETKTIFFQSSKIHCLKCL